MPRIHVCSLSRMSATVAAAGASHLVTLINSGTPVERPGSIPAERHLMLGVSDIVAPIEGLVPPTEHHIRDLVAFVDAWDQAQPLVIHCFAGISRSTAAAYITLCQLAPDQYEADIAARLRQASPAASPNPRLVELADRQLGRDGRMIDAVATIGIGVGAFEGEPFWLPIRDRR